MRYLTVTPKFQTTAKVLSVMAALFIISACGGEKTASSAQAKTTTQNMHAATEILSTTSDAAVVSALQANLDKSQVAIQVQSALPTAMPGIYWASFEGAPAMFTDKTGTHLIQGEIFQIGGDKPIDVGGQVKASLAKDALAKVDKSEMIIVPATGEQRAAVYVFTDPTCSYCQKLHSEINLISQGGVEVRYLAWPRSEDTIPLTERIWCSNDRLSALAAAEKGQAVTSKNCDNPVKRHILLGRALGITGTPAIFTESGMQIGGYVPAGELIKLAIDNK